MTKKTASSQTDNPLPTTPLAFILFTSAPHWRLAVATLFIVIFASATSQGTSYFFKLIIDAAEAGDKAAALRWGLLYPVAIFVVQLLYRLSGLLGALWSNRAYKTGYDALTSHLFAHSHSFFADRFAGSITSKVRNVVGAIESVVPDFIWGHLNSVVAFLVTFAMVAAVDLRASLMFLALVVVLFFLNRQFAPKKAVYARANAEAATALQGRLVDVLGNMSAVRQYVLVGKEQVDIAELSERKRVAGINNWLYTERMLLANSFVLFLFAFAMFYILVARWGSGAVTTGEFVLVVALISQVTGSLLFIGRAFNSTARTVGEMREGLDDLMAPYEVVDKVAATPLVVTSGQVSWQDVSFTFDQNQVFDQLKLTIQPGQRVGLVGPSGAGKSTFVSLLLRQYDIQSGTIAIDGQNIADVTQNSLREAVAVVPQEPVLFHRTVRDNILYGNPHATEAEMIDVAKKAQAHDFIMLLTHGYDTLVGERGIKLSGGQKQRIAIARAMLKDAPILVLDEATSALDSESEVAIQKALHVMMAGKTVVAIAHRLSTLREMDRIIVLDKGKIVEDGSHDALLAYDGTFARLWKHQAGGFLQE